MFQTRDDIIKALTAIMVEPYDITYPEDQKPGILDRIFGRDKAPEPSISYDEPFPFPKSAAAAIADLAQVGLRLERALVRGTPKIGASRIGGAPDLPTGMDWPTRPAWTERAKSIRDEANAPDSRWSSATPEQRETFRKDAAVRADYYESEQLLPFLAQINFAELNAGGAIGDMPTSGVLSLFYDMVEQPWGFDPKDAPGFHLIWHEGGAEGLERRTMPDIFADTSIFYDGPVMPRTLKGSPTLFLPDDGEAVTERLNIPEAIWDAYREWTYEREDNMLDHRLGGYPAIVQNPMQEECALVTAGKYCGNGDAYSDPANAEILATAKDWILLLQIDSDEEAGGIMWGDSGKLYVWIKRQDLAARAFEKAWVILQCY